MAGMTRALVTGAGGFIGGWLCGFLKERGLEVEAVDVKEPEFREIEADEFFLEDLRRPEVAPVLIDGVDEVWHLAADMGGIGYLSENHAEVASSNALMDAYVIRAAAEAGARLFYASSACVYPAWRQSSSAPKEGLRESEAIPADPEPGYGWEKLFAERLCADFERDRGLEVRLARFHNVYGPWGTFEGGREKAPAALCRKAALAAPGGPLEVWGDGEQIRSFLWIEDCLEGMWRLMRSSFRGPLNLGTERAVSIRELAEMVARISGKELELRFVEGPEGVRFRNSDNGQMRRVLRWEPSVPLEQGLEETYGWIAARAGAAPDPA